MSRYTNLNLALGGTLDSAARIQRLLNTNSPNATKQLFELVYAELRQMAAAKMARERKGHTLDATGLVHEAFMRLAEQSAGWESRRHFFGAAAEAMRRILIDSARSRGAEKRGGKLERDLGDIDSLPAAISDERVEALSAAIDQLEVADPAKAELVKLRYFAGLTIREAAQVLQISTATADRHWAYARAWLQNSMQGSGRHHSG